MWPSVLLWNIVPSQCTWKRPPMYCVRDARCAYSWQLSWVRLIWAYRRRRSRWNSHNSATAADDELSKLPQQSVLEQMGLQSAFEHRQRQLWGAEWRRKLIPRRRSMDGEAPLADSCSRTRDKSAPMLPNAGADHQQKWLADIDLLDSTGLHRVGTFTPALLF